MVRADITKKKLEKEMLQKQYWDFKLKYPHFFVNLNISLCHLLSWLYSNFHVSNIPKAEMRVC